VNPPLQNLSHRVYSIRKISICVNPHLRLSAFICGFKKKPDYMVGAGSPRAMPLNRETGKPAPTTTRVSPVSKPPNREAGKLAPTRHYSLPQQVPIAREFDYPHDVPVRQPSYAMPNYPHDW
jgi:hypothetical protein